MNKRFVIFIIVFVFAFYFILRICQPDIFWPKVKIINKVIVPQGNSLYLKDIRNNTYTEKKVPIQTIENYFDNFGDYVLYSTWGDKGKSFENQVLAYNYSTGKSKLFYSLNAKIWQIYNAKYSPVTNMLSLLYIKKGTTYVDLVNMKTKEVIKHIKTSFPENDNVSYFDINESYILLSVANNHFFEDYYSPLGDGKNLKIYLLDLKKNSIRKTEALGYNAIFNPTNPDEVFAMKKNKQLYSYNLKTRRIRLYGIKCIFIRWIAGTNSLLVVKPIALDNFADVGVFDVINGKYTRIVGGGWAGIYQAFYE